jgi:CheY-like chemotaxis protein
MIPIIKPTRFLVIDDDVSNNFLCESAVKILFPECDVLSFTNPNAALMFMADVPSTEYQKGSTVVFLDINMPHLDGWRFLDKFEEFEEHLREKFVVYMLTSSIARDDEEKAGLRPGIAGFLTKPLIVSELRKLFLK